MRVRKISNSAIFLVLFFTITLSFAGDYWLKISKVIDGDTFVLETGKKVRLIGVDTPETVHPSKPVEYFGKEASAFTKKMLTGKKVRLEFDQQKVGKYGRILAYVFLEDSTFFNAELIKQGYAHAYTKYPFRQDYMDLFKSLEKEAREQSKGLWAKQDSVIAPPDSLKGKLVGSKSSNKFHKAECKWAKKIKPNNLVIFASANEAKEKNYITCKVCSQASSITKKIDAAIKGQNKDDIIVYRTQTGKKYHRAGCRYLKKSKISIPLKNASLLYSPCSVCKPPTLQKKIVKPKTKRATPIYSGRCQATTKKGTQCKRKAKSGSRYCWQHK